MINLLHVLACVNPVLCQESFRVLVFNCSRTHQIIRLHLISPIEVSY